MRPVEATKEANSPLLDGVDDDHDGDDDDD
jgi:hypothetical protein